MEPLDRIRELCGNITNLSDQELAELRDLVLQKFDQTDNDAGDTPDEDTMAVLAELADASDAAMAEFSRRGAVQATRTRGRDGVKALAELALEGQPAEQQPAEGAGEVTEGTEGDGGTEGTGDGTEGDEEGVTAGGAVKPPERNRPKPGPTTTTTITASADIPGVALGHEFSDALEVGSAFSRRLDTLARTRGGDGEQVIVASIRTQAPEERTLHNSDPENNFNKVLDVVKPQAITAAGGVVAPVAVRYDLFGTGVTDRPVRDALPSFNADRGGIRFVTPPTLGQLTGAVGIWTLEDDADAALADDPGATPPFVSPRKPVLRVNAGQEVVVNTQAVTVGLVFGNMQARAYPELVARHNDLAMIAHARVAEQQLLAQIGALSLKVTAPAQVVGAARHLLGVVSQALASYRNRYRVGDLPVRIVLPQWFKDMLRNDLAMQMPGDGLEVLALADTTINGWFTARNCNVTWALEGEAGQDFGAQADNAALLAFPANLIFYIFVEGTFLFLDGGTLDLGIVRDSTLNSRNDYQTFVETFEAVAKVGHEGLRVTAAIEPTGASSAAVAV